MGVELSVLAVAGVHLLLLLHVRIELQEVVRVVLLDVQHYLDVWGLGHECLWGVNLAAVETGRVLVTVVRIPVTVDDLYIASVARLSVLAGFADSHPSETHEDHPVVPRWSDPYPVGAVEGLIAVLVGHWWTGYRLVYVDCLVAAVIVLCKGGGRKKFLMSYIVIKIWSLQGVKSTLGTVVPALWYEIEQPKHIRLRRHQEQRIMLKFKPKRFCFTEGEEP